MCGRVSEVRFSNSHMQPIRRPHAEIVDFYTVYRHFAELANQPQMQLTFKPDPGDGMIFDNTRVLQRVRRSRRAVPPRIGW